MNTLQPQHQHDCDRCIFLGHYYDGARYDLYFCDRKSENRNLHILVARFGSKPGYDFQYQAESPRAPLLSQPLQAAQEMAQRRGLL